MTDPTELRLIFMLAFALCLLVVAVYEWARND